jgi:hypothetical protein
MGIFCLEATEKEAPELSLNRSNHIIIGLKITAEVDSELELQ